MIISKLIITIIKTTVIMITMVRIITLIMMTMMKIITSDIQLISGRFAEASFSWTSLHGPAYFSNLELTR